MPLDATAPAEKRPLRERTRWRSRLSTMLVLVALAALATKYVALPIWEDYTLSPVAKAHRAVRAQLERTLVLDYPPGTTLDSMIGDMRSQTRCAWLPYGIPCYIDPIGLREAAATPKSPITYSSEGVPLKDALHRLLRPIGLDYYVSNGLVFVTSIEAVNEPLDPMAVDTPRSQQ